MAAKKSGSVTVADIIGVNTALQLTGNLGKLNAKVAYRLAHNRRVSDEVRKIYQFQQDEIANELGERDEEGNVIKTPMGNGYERIKYGANIAEAEKRLAAIREAEAPMDDFRYLSMDDIEAISEAATQDTPLAEIVYGLYPIVKE